MMEWERLFKSRILERGYDYYTDERVRINNIDEHRIEACVEGSEAYDVVIDIEDGNILSMECSCPYAADGNNCKHMAAVLYKCFGNEDSADDYELESDYLTGFMKNKEMVAEDVSHLLSIIPEEEKQLLLTNILIHDSQLRTSLKLKHAFNIDAKQLQELRQEIDDIVNENCYRGYVDWNHAFDFCCSLRHFLEDRVDMIIAKGALKPAFELTNKIFILIGSIDMDDSDGGSGIVAEKCYSIWKNIYQQADDDAKAKIKGWFFSYKEGYLLDWIEEYLLEFRDTELASPEDIIAFIKELDAEIEARGTSNECGYIYTITEGRISLIDKRIAYMQSLGMTKEDVDDYCEKHMQFSVVRIRKIKEYIEAKAYEAAIDLLIKSKKLDACDESLLTRYSKKLIELYKLTGKDEDYFIELKFNLLNCEQSDVTQFKELKSLYQERQLEGWDDFADLIIERNCDSHVLYDLLVEEHKFEQLMDTIEEYTNVYILDKYLKVLSKEVPDRVIHLYATYIEDSMEHACERKAYRSIAKYLKTMSFSEVGRVKATELANNLKKEYPRRSAMLDELKKIGF